MSILYIFLLSEARDLPAPASAGGYARSDRVAAPAHHGHHHTGPDQGAQVTDNGEDRLGQQVKRREILRY